MFLRFEIEDLSLKIESFNLVRIRTVLGHTVRWRSNLRIQIWMISPLVKQHTNKEPDFELLNNLIITPNHLSHSHWKNNYSLFTLFNKVLLILLMFSHFFLFTNGMCVCNMRYLQDWYVWAINKPRIKESRR